MREILFRGKKKYYNCDWIEGYLVKLGRESFSDPERYGICNKAIPVGGSGVCYNLKIDEVIPETVGQYTGLTDKNGKKIFEGDIVRLCRYALEWEDKSNWKFEIGYIRFKNGCFIIEDIYSSDGYNELSCVYDAITCGGEYDSCVIFEVIGNKWDNPELLKGGEQ